MQIGGDILAFTEGSKDCKATVSVLRLLLESQDEPKVEMLPSLEGEHQYAKQYAVALYMNACVYLTGGKGASSCLVSQFNLADRSWTQAPSLNQGRHGHSSCTLCDTLYVFGG